MLSRTLPKSAKVKLKELLRKFRFEPERITEIAKELLGKNKKT